MNTFTVGQKVRITAEFGKIEPAADDSFESYVGKVGTVVEARTECGRYVRVDLAETEWPWLYLPEELEAV